MVVRAFVLINLLSADSGRELRNNGYWVLNRLLAYVIYILYRMTIAFFKNIALAEILTHEKFKTVEIKDDFEVKQVQEIVSVS